MSPELRDLPCSACGLTSELGDSCNYPSHVKLFYGASDRGAWALGSKFILKERSAIPPNDEAVNINYIQQNTCIPVPKIVKDWKDSDDRYFILMERIEGETLADVWPKMSIADKERVADQAAKCLLQLRKLQSSSMGSLEGHPVYSAFLFPDGTHSTPHGPFSADDELWRDLVAMLGHLPEKARARLRACMPTATPFTFTHGDLTTVNIIVRDGNLAGIIDWEAAGFFPAWWEFVSAGIGLGEDDAEWKGLLGERMPHHETAHEFWLKIYTLCRYPVGDDAGKAMLEQLLHE
ncbi:hypothetical protein MMC16_007399 [Acarospora aff. strigata]|nr:hypothetical protein [Acarospora aff. strigata]